MSHNPDSRALSLLRAILEDLKSVCFQKVHICFTNSYVGASPPVYQMRVLSMLCANYYRKETTSTLQHI